MSYAAFKYQFCSTLLIFIRNLFVFCSRGYTREVEPERVHYVGASPDEQSVVVLQMPKSFVGEIVFSCIVFWVCNPLFGLIAFILAGGIGYTRRYTYTDSHPRQGTVSGLHVGPPCLCLHGCVRTQKCRNHIRQ